MKQADFGRNSLRSMLADNQNLLAETAEPVQAEKLLEMGTGEIERTPFLTPEDKQFYRDGYLKTGILNLALNSPETAEAAADRYFPGDSDGIKARIAETRRLNEEGAKRQQERERQRSYLAAYGDASHCGRNGKGGKFLRRNIMCFPPIPIPKCCGETAKTALRHRLPTLTGWCGK